MEGINQIMIMFVFFFFAFMSFFTESLNCFIGLDILVLDYLANFIV